MKATQINSTMKIFNVSSGVGHSLKQIISHIELISQKKLQVNFTGSNRKFDVPINVLDSSLFKNDFGWEPKISLEQGISNTWNWIKDQKF